MVDGDIQICSYEGLGTLTNPVKNEGTPAGHTARPGHQPALKKVGRGGVATAALDECGYESMMTL